MPVITNIFELIFKEEEGFFFGGIARLSHHSVLAGRPQLRVWTAS